MSRKEKRNDNPYADVMEAIRAAGFASAIHPLGRTSRRLVCAKSGGEWGLGGGSFWIVNRRGKWIIATWLPEYYQLPNASRRVELVLALLNHDPPVGARFPASIVAEFKLIPCSWT